MVCYMPIQVVHDQSNGFAVKSLKISCVIGAGLKMTKEEGTQPMGCLAEFLTFMWHLN